MATSTLPATNGTNQAVVLTPAQSELLDKLKATIPLDRQLSWLQLSNLKQTTEKTLIETELSLQPLLKDYTTMKVDQLEKAIDEYKEGVKKLTEIRKSCTRYVDKITDGLMVIEKRAGGEQKGEDGKWKRIPEFILDKASARLIELKEAAEEEGKKALNRTNELASFKTHIQNGLVKIKTEYEKALNKTILDGYAQALKQELTEDGLKQFVKVTEAAMRDVKRIAPEKYDFQYWDKSNKDDLAELTKVNNSVIAPDWAKLLSEYIKKMRDQFNLYWQDKGTGDAGLDFISGKADEFENLLDQKANETMAVNTLANKGAAISSITPAVNFKPLNRKMTIVVKDSDPTWANLILTYFLANWNTCAPRLKVTKWSNLTIKQMATALQEESEMFDGLEYVEVKK